MDTFPYASSAFPVPPLRPHQDFGVISHPPEKTFASASKDNLSDLVVNVPVRSEGTFQCPSSQKTFPSVYFSEEEISKLSEPFQLCLVFQFDSHHLPIADVRKILHVGC